MLRRPRFVSPHFVVGAVAFFGSASAQYVTSYEYDVMGRLVATSGPNGTITYCYDLAGNIETMNVGLGCANTPPNAVNDSVTISGLVASIVDVTHNDTDPDNHSIFVSEIVIQPSNASAAIESSSSVLITPTWYGTNSFQYRIDDGQGGDDTATVTVTVNNRPPTALDDSSTLQDGYSIAIVNVIANDSDPDSDVLRVISCVPLNAAPNSCAVSSSTEVTVTASPGSQTYTLRKKCK